MLHMILLVLKFIGIALASVIGVLFLLLILALFVPIRYRIAVKYYDEPEADVKVGWLFRAIYMRVRYLEGKPDYKLRILGMLLVDSTRERKRNPRREKKKRKRGDRKKNRADEQAAKEEPRKEALLEEREIGDISSVDDKSTSSEDNSGSSAAEDRSNNSSDEDNEKADNDAQKKEFIDRQASGSSDGKRRKRKESAIHKVISFFRSIPDRIRKIKESLHSILDNIQNIVSKIVRIKEFIFDENNKLGFVGALRYLLKYVKHFAPVKFHTYIHFGTGDPCLTGQILGITAAVLPIYHESIRIVPDFENAVIEGEIDAKGRIRLLTLLIITLKVLFDKDLRGLKDSLFKLKEEL